MAKFVTYKGESAEDLDDRLTQATAGKTDFQVLRYELNSDGDGYIATLMFMKDNGNLTDSFSPEERRIMEINNFRYLSESYDNPTQAALDLGYTSVDEFKKELNIR